MCVHACMRAEPLIKERKLYHHSLECYRMLVVIVLNHRNVCVHACMRAEPLIKVRKLYHHSLECYRMLVVIVLNHRSVCVCVCACIHTCRAFWLGVSTLHNIIRKEI